MHYYKLFWGVVEGCFSLIIVSPTSKTLPLPRHFFVVRRVSPKWESATRRGSNKKRKYVLSEFGKNQWKKSRKTANILGVDKRIEKILSHPKKYQLFSRQNSNANSILANLTCFLIFVIRVVELEDEFLVVGSCGGKEIPISRLCLCLFFLFLKKRSEEHPH